jgi:hypothetical protein
MLKYPYYPKLYRVLINSPSIFPRQSSKIDKILKFLWSQKKKNLEYPKAIEEKTML